MSLFPESPLYYIAFCIASVMTLKEVNSVIWEPYMDEPFHVPQAQAYCNGEWSTWDPKITTPPGLYVIASVLRYLFMFKCKLPLLRLVPTLHLLALPPLLARLQNYYKRIPPSEDITQPSIFAVTLAFCPIAWFFGFLFYTDIPGLVFVLAAFVAQANNQSWVSALLGLISITFRQTNVIWILYIFAYDQILHLRRQRKSTTQLFHDPPALASTLDDVYRLFLTLPRTLWDILPRAVPFAMVVAVFTGFVVWNGGIVLGDKSNHVPSLHFPQLFYFYAFATFLGWPVLLFGGRGELAGPIGLVRAVYKRMFGDTRARIQTCIALSFMMVAVHVFTIHHPFILSDNRHYTFYIWKRIIFCHPLMPYLLTPIYLAAMWAWWIRVGAAQSLSQALLLPILLCPVLIPTPLLEIRYFIIPYFLLRLQVTSDEEESTENENFLLPAVELLWYLAINLATIAIFLYYPRDSQEGVLRFMW